jgi:RNA recognition motif-containing protein
MSFYLKTDSPMPGMASLPFPILIHVTLLETKAHKPMKLLIRNLDRSTTEEELRALFAAYGTVQSCDLVADKVTGASKGFAFVEMPHSGDAKAAMKKLNNINLANSKIRVKKAESKKI